MKAADHTEPQPSLSSLPGAELIEQGLDDLRAGRVTAAACLVSIARRRLVRAGLLADSLTARLETEPELTLYRLLRKEPGDAYSRYNSLLRRLVSFERSLDKRQSGRKQSLERLTGPV